MDAFEDFDSDAGGASVETMRRIARLPLQRIATPHDLDNIAFDHGLATVEVDADLVPRIAFKNARRSDAARVAAMADRIAESGYRPLTPVICRIGRKGKWVVVDGGHRLSALRQLYSENWRFRAARWLRARARRAGRARLTRALAPALARLARLIAGPPNFVYAILFLGPRSLSKSEAL
ncbi:MAG: ParB N-terminal domain-containing protein [Rubrimonas sp.]